MALTEKITCDHCGIAKGEANHWILYSEGPISFEPWSKAYTQLGHLCGDACASKLLSQTIAEWRA